MRSLYLGRAFGIPLYIHWTFALLPLYMLYVCWHEPIASLILAEVFLFSLFGCVLLHELGHALMARSFRIRTRDITLYPIGGVARLESMGHGASQEVCIALAGPAVNLVLIFLFAPLAVAAFLFAGGFRSFAAMADHGSGPGHWLFQYLALMCFGNALLLGFNLLPAFPMDGGRVLRAVLSVPLGLIPATAVAAGVGVVLAIGMAVSGLTFLGSPSLVLVGGYVVFVGQMELAGLRRLEAHRKREQQRSSEPPILEVLAHMSEKLDPSVPMRPIETREQSGFTGFLWDTERKVWIRWENGQRIDVF